MKDFEQILEEMENLLYATIYKETGQKYINVWKEKIWKFLAFCINGGMTNNLLTYEEIVNINKKLNGHFDGLINNILNIRIISLTNEYLEPKLNTLITNFDEIKSFYLNEDAFMTLIRTGMLNSLQGLDEDGLVTCLRIYLDYHISNSFLQSISIFLYDLSSSDSINSNASMRKAFSNLLPTFVSLFSNHKLCPSTLSIICKCFCILTSSVNDKKNKKMLLEDDIFFYINQYLDTSFEKLLYYVITLTMNILIETKEIIGEVLGKNKKLLPKLMQIVMGTNIPESFYSTKVTIPK